MLYKACQMVLSNTCEAQTKITFYELRLFIFHVLTRKLMYNQCLPFVSKEGNKVENKKSDLLKFQITTLQK